MLAQFVTPRSSVEEAPDRPMCSVGLGVLTDEIPPEFVDEVVELSGCREKRHRLLPARAVVYFVLGLCLFSGADSAAPPGYRSVMRWLTNGLRHLHGLALPTSSALTKARQRLGSKPLELLFDLRRGPLAGPGTKGALAFGLRLVAWDGTGLDAADTPENAAEFGVTQGGNPQVRLLALIECGTHALIDAAFDGVTKASEHKLARRRLHALNAGMLLLADRNFAGHELWGMVTATGSDMLWRIKKNLVFPAVEILPDGSFLSIMPTPAENLRHGIARARGRSLGRTPHGHLVRIIEYTVTIKTADGRTRTEPFRLVTTLLDHEQAPAAEIAAVYHERWEIENGYGELKTPTPRSGVHPALQASRTRLPGTVRAARRLPSAVHAEVRSGPGHRHRPGPRFLHCDGPRRSRPRGQCISRTRPSPPQRCPRHSRRPASTSSRPSVRARQEASQEHLPDQEA
ncbi:IS4 family transposase [Nonomuraea sp. 3N208]|uniref:IS4 family transposase n=1 Tax=Nonomuraea sp. 3N208 TaxID=3457421 RepID=UPI003FD190C7